MLIIKQNIAWITLNRPRKLNAINASMLKELSEATDIIEKEANVRCIIIKGVGERAFSSGADLTELLKLTQETATKFSVMGQQVFSKLEKISKPVIAAIGGYALGGGLELALACDLRIAADDAELGCPETKIGLIPAWGGTQRLPLVVGLSNAKRLIILGDRVKANEALEIGLIDRVVPKNNLEAEVEKLAQRLVEPSELTLKYVKQTLNSVIKVSPCGLKRETEFFIRLLSLDETKRKLTEYYESNFTQKTNRKQ
jgi:enoyl-CoA hydratase/carnithine racemase